MIRIKGVALALAIGFAALGTGVQAAKPDAIRAQNIPAIPAALMAQTAPYLDRCSARFIGWHPVDNIMLITSRVDTASQLFTVDAPLAPPTQISFGDASITNGAYSPDGRYLLVERDNQGDEASQIYRLEDGSLTRWSDGYSRNVGGPWSPDGARYIIGSNRQTGIHNNLYTLDPDQPAKRRLIDATNKGGWLSIAFTPDGGQLLVFDYISANISQLRLIDMATGDIRSISNDNEPATYIDLQFAPDGALWGATDKDSDTMQLGMIDLETGQFKPLIKADNWDISRFKIAPNGQHIAYVVNRAGMDQLYIYNMSSGQSRNIPSVSGGTIRDLAFNGQAQLGFTFASNTMAANSFSLDVDSLSVTRWTACDADQAVARDNVLPELFEITSFDGEPISGLLYRADAARFTGPRPLIIDLHGGPEAQASARDLGGDNYLINELGVSIFLPNVRGSTGFGKRFQTLDDGPFLRENAVKDVGAFLSALSKDTLIDKRKIAVTGASYGGYLCYASAIAFRKKIRAANCNAAISNFVTFLENTEDYRRALRRSEYGNETDPEQRKKLNEISPLTKVNRLKTPLLVSAGANDPRVPVSEAEQIIAALREKRQPVWTIIADNEGHSFRNKDNSDYLFWASILFWQQYLLTD